MQPNRKPETEADLSMDSPAPVPRTVQAAGQLTAIRGDVAYVLAEDGEEHQVHVSDGLRADVAELQGHQVELGAVRRDGRLDLIWVRRDGAGAPFEDKAFLRRAKSLWGDVLDRLGK